MGRQKKAILSVISGTDADDPIEPTHKKGPGRPRKADAQIARMEADELYNKNRALMRKTGGQDSNLGVPNPYDEILDSEGKMPYGSKLTFRQMRAVRLMVVYNCDVEKVAAEVGVKPSSVYLWKTDQDFMNEIYRCERFIHESAMRTRLNAERELTQSLHDEMLLRVHAGELRTLPFEKLVKLSTMLASESRLDDPASVTSRHEVVGDNSKQVNVSLNIIQERFNMQRIRHNQQASKAQIAASNNTELQKWLEVKNLKPSDVTIEAVLEPNAAK